MKNVGRTSNTEGMIGSSGLQAAVLTAVSLSSLSLLSILCLRYKRKSKIVQEEHQVYNEHTFQRGGSQFAVTQSKTVTRANRMTSATVESGDKLSAAITDEMSDYANVKLIQTGSGEHTYVAPLPYTAYEIDETTEGKTCGAHSLSVYANIETPLEEDDDDDDYENSQFLRKVIEDEEENEPDYVNEHGD